MASYSVFTKVEVKDTLFFPRLNKVLSLSAAVLCGHNIILRIAVNQNSVLQFFTVFVDVLLLFLPQGF
jgi:hypothetical protein